MLAEDALDEDPELRPDGLNEELDEAFEEYFALRAGEVA